MDYFDFPYRVRYGDTDKLGVSYYANYLVWFEAARTENFRALGLPYTECEKKGFFLPVAEAGIHYHAPSTYDDLLYVRTSVSELKRSSVHFEYLVFNEKKSKVICSGFTKHVFVNQAFVPVRVPEEVVRLVTPFRLLSSEKK